MAEPASGAAAAPPGIHEHRSVGTDRRVWLETLPDEAATMRLHAYCLDCGAVRSEQRRRGRPMGHFEKAVTNLKAMLEYDPHHAKLAQVQSHLILTSLAAVPDFDDPYSMPFETQWSLFLRAVQRVRPDLDVDLVESALPRDPRKARPAFIDLIAPNPGGPASGGVPPAGRPRSGPSP